MFVYEVWWGGFGYAKNKLLKTLSHDKFKNIQISITMFSCMYTLLWWTFWLLLLLHSKMNRHQRERVEHDAENCWREKCVHKKLKNKQQRDNFCLAEWQRQRTRDGKISIWKEKFCFVCVSQVFFYSVDKNNLNSGPASLTSTAATVNGEAKKNYFGGVFDWQEREIKHTQTSKIYQKNCVRRSQEACVSAAKKKRRQQQQKRIE